MLIGADDTERHKPDPEPLLEALVQARRATRRRPRTSATRPSTSVPRRRPGLLAVAVGWGGIHETSGCSRRSPDVLVHEPEELLDVL